MISRSLIGLCLVLGAFHGNAAKSPWLTELISTHEQQMAPKKAVARKHQEKGFFGTHGLILFYGSQCMHCKQFAPVLKRWADVNKAEVLALSFDNQALPEFPKFLPATTEWVNVAFQGAPINYPALFVVNPASKTLYPVGFGGMTDSELNARMQILIAKINTHERLRDV